MSADQENGHLNHVGGHMNHVGGHVNHVGGPREWTFESCRRRQEGGHVIPEGAHDLRMILGIVLNSIMFYEKPGSSNSQANYDYNP